MKRPTDASILAQQERDKPKAVEFIRNNPGLQGEGIPRHFRILLRSLESRGQIEYRNGWYVKESQDDGSGDYNPVCS